MNGVYCRLKNYLPFLIIIASLLGSCSSRNSTMLLKYPKSFNIDTLKTIAVNNPNNSYPEYKIKPFDIISVRNLQDPELLGSRFGEIGNLTFTYRVDKEGEIILPVLGNVKIIGLNQEEARQKIQELYTNSLFKNPIIELTINSLKITLLGAFNREGNFTINNDDTDLIDIIGLAGGFTDDVSVKYIRIIRGDRADPELIVVNLGNVNSLNSPKLKLQDGDIIIAEKSKLATLFKNISTFSTIATIGLVVLNTIVVVQSLK